jgi:hypothetical protein
MVSHSVYSVLVTHSIFSTGMYYCLRIAHCIYITLPPRIGRVELTRQPIGCIVQNVSLNVNKM